MFGSFRSDKTFSIRLITAANYNDVKWCHLRPERWHVLVSVSKHCLKTRKICDCICQWYTFRLVLLIVPLPPQGWAQSCRLDRQHQATPCSMSWEEFHPAEWVTSVQQRNRKAHTWTWCYSSNNGAGCFTLRMSDADTVVTVQTPVRGLHVKTPPPYQGSGL